MLTLIGAGFFVVYGVLFSTLPATFSALVTDSLPASSSSLIDMRATYGGMSIAVGIVLVMLSSNKETLRQAVVMLFLLMVCMASTRTIGMVADGDPNLVMYVYLILEVIAAALCLSWLTVTSKGQGDT